ncbi:MAG TPA: hypothetical protein EYP85_06360 [Armatimonadetes bacterium]|nr:hypothetical protein [Armatimonadota bacterium]
MTVIDARGMYYRELNQRLREGIRQGEHHFRLVNVEGQRYIADGIVAQGVRVDIYGVPGQDLAAFMDGPTVVVYNNAQDGVGNTMNGGKVVVHGLAGDVVGYGMRGGRLYVRDNVGYRVGIHLKGYQDQQPILVVGGKAGNFFGEYMAGGYLILLGATTDDARPVVGDYCATGMHGGVIYIRGEVDPHYLGREVRCFDLEESDIKFLTPILQDFLTELDLDLAVFDFERYTKIIPVSTRPYGQLYAY